MKELYTEKIIDAPVEKVWKVLTDFQAYPLWNPFITELKGDIKKGASFKVRLEQPGSQPMSFEPVCLKFEEYKAFVWEGKLFFTGIFDGRHIFELVSLNESQTKLIQREEFRGWLVKMFWKKLDSQTRKGFENMNEQLKQRVENLVR